MRNHSNKKEIVDKKWEKVVNIDKLWGLFKIK